MAIAAAVLGAGIIGMFSMNSAFLQKVFYKIMNRIKPPSEPKPESEKEASVLAQDGPSITVETALNSRCTSDYDDNPKLFHWGIFDKTKKLSPAQIEKIITHAQIPRFTDAHIEIVSDKNMLTFIMDHRVQGSLRDWVMVESGMQQQALGLVCAALGVGYVFSTLGVEGQFIRDDQYATVNIKLDAMKPSYNGAYWSSEAPSDIQPWKRGELPDPIRKGSKPLLAALGTLKTVNNNGRQTLMHDVGQLLWAARGRTPHYYKSDPWGMTIPTYQGRDDLSEVFLIHDGRLSKYVNWNDNSPTSSLKQVSKIDARSERLLATQYKLNHYYIVLNKKESPARSLWEIGYQLMNLLVQADALDISYQAVLLNNSQKELFNKMGINDPVALLVL